MGAMGNVKLSVAMIKYNHERFIAQAFQSALEQQTDFECEIVIGEDCSTDRTREIVTDFHRRYPSRGQKKMRQRQRINQQVLSLLCVVQSRDASG